jgi:RNA polymerase sigma-70 factor (ECF subfamily)
MDSIVMEYGVVMRSMVVVEINNEKTESSFREYYHQYWKELYRFSYRFLQDADESRDIIQEAFTRLHLFMQGGETLNDPKAWLYKVTTNLCLNTIKRGKKTLEVLTTHQHMAALDNKRSHTLNCEEKALKEEREKIFQKVFLSLDAKDRLLLNLKWENFTYTEIADILGLKIDTIGKKLFRLRHKLAERIKRRGYYDMSE